MKLNWNQNDVGRGKTVITAIDTHAAGEPLRIITGGLPELPGDTILKRRRYMQENLDHLRRALIHEPRGHFNMYGCVVTEPVSPGADLGVLFLHNEGYSTMCGHGVIALVMVLLETGAFPSHGRETSIVIDTPAGVVRATGHLSADGRVERVSFLNVASFLYEQDLAIDVPGVGRLVLDVAFGGAFYAVLPAGSVGCRVTAGDVRSLIDAAAAIKKAVISAVRIEHPLDDDLSFLYGVIFTDCPEDPSHHSRNLCVFADSEVDRSPTGTGVSARLALHHHKGEIRQDETVAIESILGRESVFEGRIVEVTQFGPHAAVVAEVCGRAFITGRHELLLDSADSLGSGFLIS